MHLRHEALVLGVLLASLAGCGNNGSTSSENYGNLLNSPAGLVLVEDEHPTGWTRPNCFACHEVRNIHTVNRTGLTDEQADLAGVRAIVEAQGQASCSLCHGQNGVMP